MINVGSPVTAPHSFTLVRAKANVVNDTAPAKNADLSSQHIDVPLGKTLKYFVEILTAADAFCTDGSLDIQWCEYDAKTTYWTPGTSNKRVGVANGDEILLTMSGRLYPMLTTIAGTAPAVAAKVNIYARIV